MHKTLPLLCLAVLLAFCQACAGVKAKEDSAKDEAKLQEYGAKLRKAFELGKAESQNDPLFVERLEDEVLAETLRLWFSPAAGARRLLSFRDQRPDDPLNAVFLAKDEKGRYFSIEDDPDFQAGNFFNAYEKPLFQPFFRVSLLSYIKSPGLGDEEMKELCKGIRLGAAFTPRYAGFYPNQLQPEVRAAMEKYLKEHEKGPVSDRLRFLDLFDQRNGAWSSRRAKLDAKMSELGSGTQDELLKIEIKDALETPFPAPENSFWMSLALPGLGQVSNGDLQGGILLGGLTAAAWIWLVGKLGAAGNAPNEGARAVAYGDAAWAGSLVALGHLFTAYNAAEQVRFFNIVLEWDLLSRPRLKP